MAVLVEVGCLLIANFYITILDSCFEASKYRIITIYNTFVAKSFFRLALDWLFNPPKINTFVRDFVDGLL